jgi:hypothetical protein
LTKSVLQNSSQEFYKIPKIIHQIWIGSKTPPINLMNTWKNKHSDYEYILWNEDEIKKRQLNFECLQQINTINEICGKVDIIRWEILYKYGGIAIDADSYCIEPFDDFFLDNGGFATFENENCRENLIAIGTMGFAPKHPLCKEIIEHIKSDACLQTIKSFKAWYSVGPVLLTNCLQYKTNKYPDIKIYPSHYFLPIHFTGLKYSGHQKVYAHQLWGSSNFYNYDNMNSFVLPIEFTVPLKDKWVSILIVCYNTERVFLKNSLNSIKEQIGYFGIELVCVNNGSLQKYSIELEDELQEFIKTSRFCKLVYEVLPANIKSSDASFIGELKCSNNLILKMNSNDTLHPCKLLNHFS